jgi:chemotaxis signal transduction protein
MKFADYETAKPRRTGVPEQVILFLVANQPFAVAAKAVQEIRSTDSLSGTANEIECLELGKVRHTVERARQTYYVVNAGIHFGLPVSRPTLVMILRGLRVAVLVDRIDRMSEISSTYPLPHAFTGKERQWYRGLAYVDDRVIPVVQPGGFLTEQEIQRLDSAAMAESAREFEGAVRE